jgi:hypothetical protein
MAPGKGFQSHQCPLQHRNIAQWAHGASSSFRAWHLAAWVIA